MERHPEKIGGALAGENPRLGISRRWRGGAGPPILRPCADA
ncbi:hypothetical protein FH063_006372 [Azospirillum argentinense]|uniref:Uncharacterized protein n=1 Tax=Azospirillum argentinense TaxID=2970906 RepID=A0A5B0KPD1_9PROT|nr:hypothetical protein FH063_006372 [Azospirillum argentinense]